MKRKGVAESKRHGAARTTQALMVLCGVSTATVGLAQEGKAKKDQLEEVVVTGTRIQRDGYQAPNATVVVSAEDMKTLGVTTVAEMITQMPNNIGRITPETVGDSPTNLGGTIADLRGLNTSGGTRTLTLVDSKRFVATNDGGSVDLNVIPSALVSRMETVTGGASATYGSDALAGVVNIILDKELDGVRMDANWGQTAEGDGDKQQYSVAAGKDLFNNKGHFTAAYEHSKQSAITDCTTRDYCRESRGLLQNGSSAGIPYNRRSSILYPGEPQWIVQNGLRYGGLGTGNIWTDPQRTGRYYTFNEAGNALVPMWADLTPQQIGAILNAGPDGTTPFGTGDLKYNQVAMLPETTRDTIFTHFSYRFDNEIKVQADLSYTSVKAQAEQNSNRQMGYSADIRPENAYVGLMSLADQEVITSRMVNTCAPRPFMGAMFRDTTRCLTVRKLWNDQLNRVNDNDTRTTNISLEVSGPLGPSWTWDAFATYGRTKREQRIDDWATRTRWSMAVDSVLENGQPVCRVKAQGAIGDADRAKWLSFYKTALADNTSDAVAQSYVNALSAGCVPLNPFGYGASPESLAYSWPTYPINTDMTLKQTSVTVSGELWHGIGAGAFKLASGVDAYQDTTESNIATDPILASDFLVSYGGLWSGRTTNVSPFAELELPLLRNKPGIKYLMTNLAYRRTNNKTERLGEDPASSSRNVESWKASLVWQPIESVRIRATRSADVRAPSARELYLRTASTVGSLFGGTVVSITNPFVQNDPSTPDDESNDTYRSETGGNTQLKAEKATNETLGIVFTPGGSLKGWMASVDYYETTIKGGIASLFASDVLNGCYQEITMNRGTHEFCQNVTFGEPTVPGNPYSNVDTIASSQVNVQPFRSRGVDYSISYFKRLQKSSVNFRLMATHFLEQSVQLGDYFKRRDVSGQVGANGIGSFFGGVGVNYSPTPSWQGNLWTTYTRGPLSSTLQIRYVGSGRLSNQGGWIGPGESGYYNDPTTGQRVGPVAYDPDLNNTINKPTIPSWTIYNLHFNYSFADSAWNSGFFEGLQLYAHIDNVFNKMPEYYTGSDAGGINAVLYSGLGRQYQVGMQYKF